MAKSKTKKAARQSSKAANDRKAKGRKAHQKVFKSWTNRTHSPLSPGPRRIPLTNGNPWGEKMNLSDDFLGRMFGPTLFDL